MSQMQKLEVLLNNVYQITVFNLKTGATKELRIGIMDVSAPYIYEAIFTCLDIGFHYQTTTWNIFATYQEFREPFEQNGWRFKTKGALKNMHPSAMQVDCYLGGSAYLIEFGKDKFESFNVFEFEENITAEDTAQNQHKFWQDYLKNPSAFRLPQS